MINNIQIKEANVDDVPVIRNIAMATWPVTYGKILDAGQIEYMLATIYHPEAITNQIKQGEQTYLIAYLQEHPVGFAALGKQEDQETHKLFKLYILPTVQQSGAGSALLSAVEDSVKNAGSKKLILNVHRNNSARQYYEKKGFTIYETIDIPFGPFVLNDYLMEKILS